MDIINIPHNLLDHELVSIILSLIPQNELFTQTISRISQLYLNKSIYYILKRSPNIWKHIYSHLHIVYQQSYGFNQLTRILTSSHSVKFPDNLEIFTNTTESLGDNNDIVCLPFTQIILISSNNTTSSRYLINNRSLNGFTLGELFKKITCFYWYLSEDTIIFNSSYLFDTDIDEILNLNHSLGESESGASYLVNLYQIKNTNNFIISTNYD